MKKMSRIARILVVIASLALIATIFFPIWNIDLVAPQYPEGLSMQIWLNKITGQVDIINGLNHYIGMKHIKAEMFPEFTYLVYVVGAFVVLGLLVALIGNRNLLLAFIFLLIAGGVTAMYDFYQWGYDYGHNLDPTAAIQVPGLSYQPPLIGHKKLLNFDAFSYPANGGWIIVAAGALFIGAWIFDTMRNRRNQKNPNQSNKKYNHLAVTSIVIATIFTSCKTGPEPFNYGKDGCHFCKMTIMSPQFGAEIITKKGKILKFDDMHCLISALKKGEVKQEDIAQNLVINYQKENDFIKAESATYVVSDQIHSPMNSNAAALSNEKAAAELQKTVNGHVMNWQSLYNQVQ
ncbi:nitrous oxide reductase accessory protein NosL [Chitinophagaceae bacterium LB-8]|uniref:Nitrous oxide reductase accessory protein NosL n=1 Tax=Paraflavisolibacter caeni TaxID=2982496 RepID=A0A9X2XUH9_9BACT|nr:nitrous oxide reductase accessory protein NosL [Paraflavisolibacter caeni]MCU7549484.1 nitrous oxide reductase accessory protein NosL [Paraflavisolibacter caeni]